MTDVYNIGSFVGRVWSKETEGPLLVKIKGGYLYDITSKETPTMRDLLEMKNPAKYISEVEVIKIPKPAIVVNADPNNEPPVVFNVIVAASTGLLLSSKASLNLLVT